MPKKHSSWFISLKVLEVWSSKYVCILVNEIVAGNLAIGRSIREGGVENAHPSRSPLALHLGVIKTLVSKSDMTRRKES